MGSKGYTALERRLIDHWAEVVWGGFGSPNPGEKIAEIETRLLESEAENQTLKSRIKELEELV